MTRHLFFDLDGTLTEPSAGIVASMQHALRAMSGPVLTVAELKRLIGPPLRAAFAEALRTDDAELVETAVRHFRDRFGTIGLFENEVYEGVPEALERLQQSGFELRVVTSKAVVYAERIVDHFGLRRYLPVVYGAELSGERSDKAELIGYALQQEGIAPADACMIGDRSHDIRGAKAHPGLRSVGVLWGYGTRDELRAAGADELVERVDELQSALERR